MGRKLWRFGIGALLLFLKKNQVYANMPGLC